MYMFMFVALLGGRVRVRVRIREQRKIKRRSKALLSITKPLMANLDITWHVCWSPEVEMEFERRRRLARVQRGWFLEAVTTRGWPMRYLSCAYVRLVWCHCQPGGKANNHAVWFESRILSVMFRNSVYSSRCVWSRGRNGVWYSRGGED